MNIKVTCSCKKVIYVPDSNAGKSVSCPFCKAILHVPQASSAAAAAPAAAQGAAPAPAASGKSSKGFVPTILLCFFVGGLGVHRFYAGKVGTGLLMLFTLGGLGIWTLIDFIMIVCGKFEDSDGLAITPGS